jgi:hypothetical protein
VISFTSIFYEKMTQDEVGVLSGRSYSQKIYSEIRAYQVDGVTIQGYRWQK